MAAATQTPARLQRNKGPSPQSLEALAVALIGVVPVVVFYMHTVQKMVRANNPSIMAWRVSLSQLPPKFVATSGVKTTGKVHTLSKSYAIHTDGSTHMRGRGT